MMAHKTHEVESANYDQRVHDAYESVTLSQEAENRMLSALLAAQAEREASDLTSDVEDVPASAQEVTEPVRMKDSRWQWPRIVLPAAACLLVALVAGRALLAGPSGGTKASEGDMAFEAVASSEAEAPSEDLPAVGARLKDGTQLKLVEEEGAFVEIPADQIGDLLGAGWTLDSQGADLVPCEVFELDPYPYGRDVFCALRIEGDPTFYLAEQQRDTP